MRIGIQKIKKILTGKVFKHFVNASLCLSSFQLFCKFNQFSAEYLSVSLTFALQKLDTFFENNLKVFQLTERCQSLK